MSDIERLKVRAQAFEDAAREIEGAVQAKHCDCYGGNITARSAEMLRTRANLLRSEIRFLEKGVKIQVSR